MEIKTRQACECSLCGKSRSEEKEKKQRVNSTSFEWRNNLKSNPGLQTEKKKKKEMTDGLTIQAAVAAKLSPPVSSIPSQVTLYSAASFRISLLILLSSFWRVSHLTRSNPLSR